MKFFVILILCAAATALAAKSLRLNESAKALPPARAAESKVIEGVVSAPVTVGTSGNEPLVTIAPDGTLYISALQHIYRSTDGGATWTKLVGPPEASQLTLASDSSISVDPGNRLYFTFDYPYAGTTAVCTTDDRGVTWACDPAVVPGGTDRMWVLAPSNSKAYEVTNEGLYETAFLTSTDRGATWIPKAIANGLFEPQSGPLLQRNCSTKVLQPIKIFGTRPEDVTGVSLYVYDPDTTGAILSDVRPTGLPLPTALPSGALSRDGVLYVASEEANASGGKQAVVARSSDEGLTWTKLPPIPGTTTGTATFTWVAADAPGHIGVLYYYTSDNGDPGTLASSNWSAVWAESYNGDSATPAWTVTTVENLIHTGAICIAADCVGTNRFAGDFINAIIDSTGVAHLTWMKRQDGTGTISIRYQKVQSGPPSIYVPPACGSLPLPVQLNKVVSRKEHGGAGKFDIDLPVAGPHGIECRSSGESKDYTMVFTFSNPLHSVESANVASGTGSVTSSGIDGTDPHQYVVNLSGVTNAQHLFVTLRNVHDEAGRISDAISAPMSVLVGDVTANKSVSNTDVVSVKAEVAAPVTSSNFRNDVNANGTVSNTDVSVTKAQVSTTLP